MSSVPSFPSHESTGDEETETESGSTDGASEGRCESKHEDRWWFGVVVFLDFSAKLLCARLLGGLNKEEVLGWSWSLNGSSWGGS